MDFKSFMIDTARAQAAAILQRKKYNRPMIYEGDGVFVILEHQARCKDLLEKAYDLEIVEHCDRCGNYILKSFLHYNELNDMMECQDCIDANWMRARDRS